MNRQEKLELLAKAAEEMASALVHLKRVANDKSDAYYLCPDAGYYAGELGKLLSCDDGQGGLVSLIKLVSKRK